MADTKVSALAAVASVAGTEELPCNSGGISKKLTPAQIATYLKAGIGMPRVFRLASDHAIVSTTATKVVFNNTPTLEAGTYVFQYYILALSATLTVTPMWGINFTGTAAVKSFRLRYPGTGTTAISGVADDAGATSGQIEESVAQNAYSTTVPNLGATGGVATINSNILYVIEGLLIVTASGDLELWHGSETATSTTTVAGTSLIVTRTV